MDIRNLNTLIHVAELGSFSQAAERLGYSQPTISVQIRQLEEELGYRLFDRIGHAVRLTDQGRDALRYAQQICQLCQQMTEETDTSAESRTVIRLATADSLCAPLVSSEFSRIRERHSNIAMKLTTAGTTELFRLLDHNEVDLVCTLDSHIYNTSYVVAGEKKVGVHLVAPVNHPLAQSAALTKQQICCQEFVLTEKGMSYRRLLDEWLAQDSLEVQPILELGSAELLCKMVEDGVGMSFLPDYVTEDAVRCGRIVRLEAENFHPDLWKQLLYRKDKWLSRPMQSVIGHLVAGL